MAFQRICDDRMASRLHRCSKVDRNCLQQNPRPNHFSTLLNFPGRCREAVASDPSIANEMLEAFLRRRNQMLNDLSGIPGIKLNLTHGAFYLFPDISGLFGKSFNGKTLNNSDDVAMFLIEEAHVATVSGSAFGTRNALDLVMLPLMKF